MSRLKCIYGRPEATWLLYLATGLLATLFATAAQAANFGGASSTNLTTLAEPNQVVSGDFDGDGNLDLAFVSVADNMVRLRKGDGTGGFAEAVTVVGNAWGPLDVEPDGDGPFAITVGHFNDDATVAHPEYAFLDIAVANVYSDNVSIFMGKGNGTFYAPTVYDVGINPTSIVTADFDEDGLPDFAVTNYGSDTVSILMNNGDGTFTKHATDPATAAGPFALKSAALINAGHQDLIVAAYTADKVSVLLGNGDGTFAGKVDTTVGVGPSAIATGFFNAGNARDVAVTNFDDDTVSVLLGVGDGTIPVAVSYDVGLEPISVAVGDFNGTLTGTMSAGGTLVTGNKYTVLTRAALDFTEFGAANNTAGTTFIATADTLVSGGALVVGTTYQIVSRTTTDFTANSCGAADNIVGTTFVSGCTSALGTGDSVITVGKLGTGDSVTDFKAGQLDGKIDLAVANRGDDNITILRGDGLGVFTFAENNAVGVGPSSVITADLNKDTIIDLVTANRFDDSGSVLLALKETTPPTGSIVIASGDVWVDNGHVPLTLSATDESGGALSMCISNTTTCSQGTDWIDYATSYLGETFTMGSGSKLASGVVYTITGQTTLDFTDTCGAASNAVGTIFTATCTSALDTGDSVISLTKSEGALTVANKYKITANAGTLDFTTCGAADSNVNTTFVATSACTLTDGDTVVHNVWETTAGDGLKTVYAWFKDVRGNVSANYFDTIIVDSTAPGKPIVINNNDDYTNSHAAILSLGGAGSTAMCISDTTTCDGTHGTDWIAYTATMAWPLPAGDGTKTVYAQFKNARATSVLFSDNIIIDSTAPTGTVVIDSGKSTAFSTSVNLTLAASEESGGDISMCINNTGINTLAAPCSPWVSYATSKSWTLAAADPAAVTDTKTVYAWFMDERGNVSSVASDTIVLQGKVPTGSVLINNGDLATKVAAATLQLTFSSNAVDMCLASSIPGNDPATPPSCTVWIPARTTLDWTLSGVTTNQADDGKKYVWAWFRTEDGIVSDRYSDFITVDNTPPTNGEVHINRHPDPNDPETLIDGTTTISTNVTLTLSATDATTAIAEMCISNTATCTEWISYVTTKAWTLDDSEGDGTKTVYAWFKDAEKNFMASPVSTTILLDATAPTGSVVINGGDISTNNAEVTLAISASDPSTTTQMCISNSTNCAQGSGWIDYATSYSKPITLGEGEKLVSGTSYRITARATVDFTTFGAANNNVGTNFIAAPVTLTSGKVLVVGNTYKITANAGTVDFTTCGAANSNVNTTFVATSVKTLTAGDTVSTVIVKLGSGDSVERTAALAAGASLVEARNYTITGRTTLNFTAFGAASNAVGTTFVATANTLATGASLVAGTHYKITDRAIFDFTTFGAADNNVGTTFLAGPSILTSGAALVIGHTYQITANAGTLDFTTLGAANNDVNTIFVATAVGTLTAGDTVSRIVPVVLGAGDSVRTVGVLGTGDSVIGAAYTKNTWTLATGNVATSLSAGEMLVVGQKYIINSQATLDFTACSAANNSIGTVFTATKALVLGAGDSVSSVGTLGTGASLVKGTTYKITAHATLDFTHFGAADNNINTTFVAAPTTLTADAVLAAGNTYKITGQATLDFTTFGAADNNVDTTFVAAPVTLSTGAVLVVGNTYQITANAGSLDFTTCGASDSNVNTTFVADFAGTLTAGDTVSTVNVVLGTDDTVTTVNMVLGTGDSVTSTGTLANGASLVKGKTYQITANDGPLDFTTFGAANSNVNTTFIAAPHTIIAGESLVAGNTYKITGRSTLDFTTFGAADNNVDTTFVAAPVTLSTGAVLVVGNTYKITANTGTLDFTTCGASDSNVNTTFVANFAGTLTAGDTVSTVNVFLGANDTVSTVNVVLGSGDSVLDTGTLGAGTTLVAGTAYKITGRTTLDFTTFGAANNTVGTSFVAASKTLTTGAILVVGNTYKITANAGTFDFTTSGATDSNVNTTFVATHTGTLTAGDTVSTVSVVLGTGDSVVGWDPTTGDGTKSVYVWFKDSFANTTDSRYADTIILDTTAPAAGSVVINAGATATNLTQVTLTISATDATVDGKEMCISNSITCNSWEAYDTTKSWAITTGDSIKEVRVWFRDALGNTTATPVSDTIVLDTAAPTGSVVINAGAASSNSTAAILTLASSGTGNEMCISDTTTCADGTGWITFATSRAWTLPLSNAINTVYVWYKDALGNATANATPYTDTILVDSTVPAGSITISGGGYTKTTAVTLTLTTDHATTDQMCISNVNPNTTPCATFVAFAATKTWNLTATNGQKTVYLTLKDASGNSNVIPGTTVLDTVIPVNPVLTATNGLAADANLGIVLNWSDATPDVNFNEYILATPTSPTAVAAPVSCIASATTTVLYHGALKTFTHKNVALGNHYYRVCASDLANNISAGAIATGKAVAEVDPPVGTVTINGGTATNKLAVTLTISATDAANQTGMTMCVSNTDTCTVYSAYAASTTKAWNLLATGADHTRTVKVWYKDGLGNIAAPVSDTIIYDPVVPVSTGATFTATGGTTHEIALAWDGFTDNEGITAYKLFGGLTAPASCIASATNINLNAGTPTGKTYSHTGRIDGTIYYYRVCAFDAAGNASVARTANAKAKPESLAPTGTDIQINADAAYTKSTAVTLTLAATDDTSTAAKMQMCISNESATCTTFVPYATTKAWTLATVTNPTNTRKVYATFRDQWGNTAAPVSSTIILDSVLPTNGTVQLTNYNGQNDLVWSGFADALPGSGAISYKLVYSTTAVPACATGTLLYTGTDTLYSHTGLVAGTYYYYRVCAIDGAGNISTGATVTARYIPEYDAPTDGAVTINGGKTYTNLLAATLTLSATDASTVSQMCISNTALTAATCTPWVAYAPTKAWTLATSTATSRTVNVWFRDQWNNTTTTAATDSIGYDTAAPVGGLVTPTAGNAQVTLDWSGFGDALSGVASYKVVSSTTTAPTTCAGTAAYTGPDTVTTATITGLINSTTYYYRVCAIDNAGNMSTGAGTNAKPLASL